jgi:hypothetical protein
LQSTSARDTARETALMKVSPATNDTVRLSGSPQLWKVIATINGTKVDLQRMDDYNLEIITVPLESIRVVGHFGSPDTARPLSLSAAKRASRAISVFRISDH